MPPLALRSSRVVLPDGVRPATVVIEGGRIVDLLVDRGAEAAGLFPVDLGSLVLGPGLVDSHVHINEPGRTDWEGFATATRAAAAGGVTTVVDMPLNSLPPTTTAAALRTKRAAAQGICHVDVAFWAGVTGAQGTASMAGLADLGVSGFKVFLADSGVPEFPPVDAEELRAALAATPLPVVVHAEAPAVLAGAPAATGSGYGSWLRSRPAEAEVAAVRLVAELAAATGAHAHVLHCSAAGLLDILEQARRDGIRLTGETCPHYLSLAAEEIPAGTTVAKCAPPIREAGNRRALWDGVSAGLFAAVVSDHSPAPAALKSEDFGSSWGGISGLQTALPVVWTAAKEHGVGLADLARLQSSGPAELAGLPRKGRIAVGADADLVAWDPEATFVVDPAALQHRHPLSPWAGRTLAGVVHSTWLAGVQIVADGAPVGNPTGRLLARA